MSITYDKPLRKDELSDTGSKVLFGVTGGGQVGCLACNKRQVVSLFGAVPLDNNIRQALPTCPE